jgi:ribonuclease P protein component
VFRRSQRITRGPELELVRREGKRVRTASFEVRATASLHALSRVGLIVPRYRHSAVARNLVKRRLRELVRLELLPALADTPPHDMVIRALPIAYTQSWDAMQREVRQLIGKLERLCNTPTA